MLNTKVESQARECLRGEEIASERLVHEMAWREMKGSCEWSSRGGEKVWGKANEVGSGSEYAGPLGCKIDLE